MLVLKTQTKADRIIEFFSSKIGSIKIAKLMPKDRKMDRLQKWAQITPILNIDELSNMQLEHKEWFTQRTPEIVGMEREREGEETHFIQNKIQSDQGIKKSFKKIKSVAKIVKNQLVKVRKVSSLVEIEQYAKISQEITN